MPVADVEWNDRVLVEYLADVEAQLIPELTSEVEDVARSLAPVRVRRTPIPSYARRGYIGTPGRLKASVHSEFGQDHISFYGEVHALWYGRFLDPKARQLHRLYPFLPTALYFVVAGRSYYL